MAEEVKNEATEKVEEKKEPKVVYAYLVQRLDNGFYEFVPQTLEGSDVPSIDKYHVALDLVDLGRRTEHQLIVEEAKASAEQAINNFIAMLNASVPQEGAEADGLPEAPVQEA